MRRLSRSEANSAAAKAAKAAIYTCTECGRGIHATADDPVHITSLGTHHAECLRTAHARKAKELSEQTERKYENRSQAAKKRWKKRQAKVK